MVSEEFAKGSDSAVLRQYLVSHTDDSPTYSESINSHAFHWHGRHQNEFLQFSCMSTQFQSLGAQLSRSSNYVPSPRLEDFRSTKRNSTESQYGNEDGDLPSMTAVLENSPYLKPAQELLDEIVCVSNLVELSADEQLRKTRYAAMRNRNYGEFLPARERMNTEQDGDICYSSAEKLDGQSRVAKLITMLNELESRYDQYFHRMNQVVSSYEVLAGRKAAASYTALTIQAMSRHFLGLREAIVTQIQASQEPRSEELSRRHRRSLQQLSIECLRHKSGDLQKLEMVQAQQVWRPLRGFPEGSVAVLRSWLFENFLHPYPNDNEKLMLASRTGLTKNQISNWFINARVRLWKPMIEEMYREEFAEESGN